MPIIEPKSSSTINSLPNAQTNTPTNSAQAARERAIAKFVGEQKSAPSQEPSPVQNPSRVSPEELSVVKPPSSQQVEQQTTQKDNSESPKEPSEAKEDKKDPLSPQYALLARKEKALRAQAQQIKAQEASFKAREDALKAKEAEYQTKFVPKDKLTSDPLAALSELGITYDQLTSMILSQPKSENPQQNAELQELKAEIKALRSAQETSQKTYEDNQKQAYEQAVSQIRNEAKQLVTNDIRFETIKETNSVRDVVDLIEKTFKEDNILLSVEEACNEIEEYLVEEAIKLAKINKIKQKLSPVQAQPAPSQPQDKPQQPQTKTLTHAINSSRPMSARERAIAAFKGEKA